MPVPLPSEVCESFIVGDGKVLQQTPLSIMGNPPSEVALDVHRMLVLVTYSKLLIFNSTHGVAPSVAKVFSSP